MRSLPLSWRRTGPRAVGTRSRQALGQVPDREAPRGGRPGGRVPGLRPGGAGRPRSPEGAAHAPAAPPAVADLVVVGAAREDPQLLRLRAHGVRKAPRAREAVDLLARDAELRRAADRLRDPDPTLDGLGGTEPIAGGALAFVQWGAWSPFVPGQPGFLGELELLLAAVGLTLMLVGAGGWSLDRSFRAGRQRDKAEKAAAAG